MDPADFSTGVRKLLKKCNGFFQEGSTRKDCSGFFVAGEQVGFVRPDVAQRLKQFPEVFDVVEKGTEGRKAGVHVSQAYTTPEERTTAVNGAMEKLKAQGCCKGLEGWHDERYRVVQSFGSKELMQIERAAATLLGITTFGCHINGFTYNDCGEILMWIAKREKGKSTYPGMFDNLCAGGLPAGIEILENAWKECQEEASIDEELLEDLKSVGTVSYCLEDERGVSPELEFIFDLELPQDFSPENSDGEVESFQLLPLSKVKELIIQDNFKPNCALIILDFLIRHGFITPDSDPDYCFIVEQIHTPLGKSLFTL